MSNSSFQSEIPKVRINLKLDLHTGGASKKTELPLKLLVAGDFSNSQESAPLSERKKVDLNKNNFDSVLSEYSPNVNLTVKNTLADDGSEDNISLTFRSMKDFTPEQVSRQIPQLKAMLSMRNLLRDLKCQQRVKSDPLTVTTNGLILIHLVYSGLASAITPAFRFCFSR
ncbi:type VI secretion system contractile sheath small subunit [Klebsiella michiganensis]|uniref:Type VI secretion protein n=1 Tax=Klebsiella michiganensis TaxID=1134687 RepID=A0ABR5GA32_9ENTR|nr:MULTISPECIES: type VI secretion system contractile sheath small subunit [Enterobacteriaceae]STV51481.1 type VI secretion system protein ImpB [Klebsiella pneumoniae]EWF77473.1 type VI secretion protein [Klebsiella michiganensis]KLY28870.1 type VI secretion protein [Klebsiella michiganensis]MDH1973736.1 type VI secretion system contractile sheath small subunit [Klebsiella michiganensis]MDM9304215.1 type VI secretion system contractile sheath small subunit [Klebsiella quasipneumoniae subsp. si